LVGLSGFFPFLTLRLADGKREERGREERETAALFLFCVVLLHRLQRREEREETEALFSFQDIL
jgi:hypothetical protein